MNGAVVLNYRTPEDAARAALELREGGIDLVVVVDNASGRDDLGILERVVGYDERIEILSADCNRGYSAGNNLGLRRLDEAGCTTAVVSNPDVSFPEGAVASLLEAKRADPEAVIVAPMLVDPRGAVETNGGWWRYRVGRGELELEAGRIDVPRHGRVRVFSGACFVIDIRRFVQIGLLPEDQFLYGEEVDVVQRLRQRGWRWSSADVEVVHDRGGSIGSATRWRDRSLIAHRYAAESAVRVTWKHWPRWIGVVVGARVAFAMRALGVGRPDIASAVLQGTWGGLRGQVKMSRQSGRKSASR